MSTYTTFNKDKRSTWPGEHDVLVIYRGPGQIGFSRPAIATFHGAKEDLPWCFAFSGWSITGGFPKNERMDIRWCYLPEPPKETEPHTP